MRRLFLKTIQYFSLSLRRERAGMRVNNDAPPTSILLRKKLCHNTVHGSRTSPRTEYDRLEINHLAVRPERVEGRMTNYDSVSKRGGGPLGYPICNSRGLSVLFLVVAMMLMVSIGYVLSYLIPTKQKSVSFTISSNQSFFLAQSGVEFAVRYATENNWSTPAQLNGLDNMTRNLGRGRFTLDYNDATDSLASVGEIPSASQRRVLISNFTSFLIKPLVLAPGYDAPCWCLGTRRTRFFIQNVGSSNITINAFSATWNQVGQPRTIQRFDMGAAPPLVQKYAGNYANGSPPVNFNRGGNSQTITPGQVIQVVAYWSGNTNGRNILINFFSPGGDIYTLNLDPEGDGLGSCPQPC